MGIIVKLLALMAALSIYACSSGDAPTPVPPGQQQFQSQNNTPFFNSATDCNTSNPFGSATNTNTNNNSNMNSNTNTDPGTNNSGSTNSNNNNDTSGGGGFGNFLTDPNNNGNNGGAFGNTNGNTNTGGFGTSQNNSGNAFGGNNCPPSVNGNTFQPGDNQTDNAEINDYLNEEKKKCNDRGYVYDHENKSCTRASLQTDWCNESGIQQKFGNSGALALEAVNNNKAKGLNVEQCGTYDGGDLLVYFRKTDITETGVDQSFTWICSNRSVCPEDGS